LLNYPLKGEVMPTPVEKKIEDLKSQIIALGPMRPGKLGRQYKDPKSKLGGYWQLSYTYKMKSKSEYVRPGSVKRIKQETATFKKFKALIDKWIDLELKRSTQMSDSEKRTN
jgi:hypothetical protein